MPNILPDSDPDVAAFLDVMQRHAALRPTHDAAAAAYVAVLEQLQTLDDEASAIRAKLSRERQQAGSVDGRGWPGLTSRGKRVHVVSRVEPFELALAHWPADLPTMP